MATYLDFEQPIADLIEQLDQAKTISIKSNVNVNQTVKELEKKIADTRKKIFSNLTPWQRVQISRHPDRPYTLSYIQNLTNGDFIELHGDRNVKDDKAMIGGFGSIDGKTYMLIGQQKGINTKCDNTEILGWQTLKDTEKPYD